MKALAQTAAVMSALAIVLHFWALLGYPPYAMFALLKGVVFVGAILSAYFTFRASPKLSPLSLALLVLGVIEVIAKMSRREWAPYDIASIVLFAAVLVIAVAYICRRDVRTGAWHPASKSLEKK